MKAVLLICCWFCNANCYSQLKDTAFKAATPAKTYTSTKPEILSSGFIDIFNNGQMNASARFIRLFVGEPGKFSFPVSIYSGVSSNNFQNQQTVSGIRTNEHLVNAFIIPLNGLLNVCMEGIVYWNKRVKITRTGFLYNNGIRILTAYKSGLFTDPLTGKPINFLNSFASGGLFFQTGAWEKNNSKNIGICWFALRYLTSKSAAKQLQIVLPGIHTTGFYHGWSLGGGIEINNLVNIKLVYYNYVKAPELDYSMPIYQFSFNYSLR